MEERQQQRRLLFTEVLAIMLIGLKMTVRPDLSWWWIFVAALWPYIFVVGVVVIATTMGAILVGAETLLAYAKAAGKVVVLTLRRWLTPTQDKDA